MMIKFEYFWSLHSSVQALERATDTAVSCSKHRAIPCDSILCPTSSKDTATAACLAPPARHDPEFSSRETPEWPFETRPACRHVSYSFILNVTHSYGIVARHSFLTPTQHSLTQHDPPSSFGAIAPSGRNHPLQLARQSHIASSIHGTTSVDGTLNFHCISPNRPYRSVLLSQPPTIRPYSHHVTENMAWFSILPAHLSFIEEWAERIFVRHRLLFAVQSCYLRAHQTHFIRLRAPSIALHHPKAHPC